MTSSDVLDTCFNLQLKQSGEILLKDINQLLQSIKKQAVKHKFTLCIGRSHGIHAEPTTMGLTFARFYAEMDRNLRRMQVAKEEISTGALSGAVGTFANLDPAVEKLFIQKNQSYVQLGFLLNYMRICTLEKKGGKCQMLLKIT